MNHEPKDKKTPPSGVDISIIRENLKLSYEQRMALHDKTLACINELKKWSPVHRARTS